MGDHRWRWIAETVIYIPPKRRHILAGRRHRERTIKGWPECIAVHFAREVELTFDYASEVAE